MRFLRHDQQENTGFCLLIQVLSSWAGVIPSLMGVLLGIARGEGFWGAGIAPQRSGRRRIRVLR